jgi:hypothetical protein
MTRDEWPNVVETTAELAGVILALALAAVIVVILIWLWQ